MTSPTQAIPAVPFTTPTLPEGYILGEYKIESVLGQGNFGITYRATELMTNYPVVIKENFPLDYAYRDLTTGELCPHHDKDADYQWALESFEKEACTLRKLPIHTNLVHVTGVIRALNTAYIVMEPVHGQNLHKLYTGTSRTTGRQMEAQLLESMLRKLLSALIPIHKQEIIHRDIKPANIMLTPEGEPVLIDFGAARSILGTHTATKIGTRGYAPPEQMEQAEDEDGEKQAPQPQPHWDLYALGCTCHQLITGRAPIHGSRKLTERPELAGNYPARLLSSIDKAREADPANRWQSAQDWLDELTADERAAQEEARRQQAQAKARTQNELVQLRTALADALEHGQQIESKLISAENKATQAEKARQQAVEEYQQAEIQISQAEKARKAAERKATQAEKARQTAEATVADMQRKLDNTPQGNTDKRRSYGCSLIVSLLLLAGTSALCYHQYRRAEDSAHMVNQEKLARQEAETKVKEAEDAQNQEKLARQKAETKATEAENALQQAKAQAQQAQNELRLAQEKLQKAEENDANAQYKKGFSFYTQKDYAKAVEWFQKAADQGNADAQDWLGVCYYNGRGVQQDYKQAVEWYQKAANQGDAAAQNRLGVCYENGHGVQKDYDKAVEWYRKAANQGNASAQYNLGTCYENGHGVQQDYKQAVEWYRKAANQGNASAQINLGACYYNGRGVQQDYKQAVEWYRKAAKQGNASAQNWLGYCYENGHGVQKNITQAIEWYRKAAKQGNANASAELKRLGY